MNFEKYTITKWKKTSKQKNKESKNYEVYYFCYNIK